MIFFVYFGVAVIPVNIKESVQVDKDLQIRAYYAGHVCYIIISFLVLTSGYA